MVEPVDDAREVADAVTVGVLVRAGIDLVEDLAVPPLLRRPSLSSRRRRVATDGRVPSAVVPIKYLGSKRRLVGVIGAMFTATGGGRALDLFTGTTRVAQELKARGGHVTAVDRARYATVFAESAIATDADHARPRRARRRARGARRAARAHRVRHRDVLPATPGSSGPRTASASTRSATRSSPAATTRTSRSCSRASSRPPTASTPPPACRWRT